MKKFLCLAALFLAACGVNPKPKPPLPPPEVEVGRPSTPLRTDLLVRQSGGKFNMPLIGAIPCWPESDDPGSLKVDGKPVGYDWTLVAPDFMDAVKAKGVNAFHIRLGPASAQDQCCGLQSIGGPYKLDGSWNELYWDRVHTVLRHAAENNQIVEIDVLDGWLVKHSIWGETHMPWPSNDVLNATAVPLNASVVAWVEKVVYETSPYGNVIYQISNEGTMMQGWTPQWERAMHALIRANEGGVVHAIGSCSRDYDGPYDYFTVHNGEADIISARPVVENEYNPTKTPAKFKADCVQGLALNNACWLWRSDAKDADWQAMLDSIKNPTSAFLCADPLPDRSKLSFSIHCDSLYGESCDATPIIEKDLPYCISIGMGEMGGQPRATCPIRNEGQPDRLTCEQWAMQAAAPVWSSDAPIVFVDTNHFRVKKAGTWLQACDATGTRCSRIQF